MSSEFRSGYVALAGRPNVGKSTLLNSLTGQKVSITSRKPQTTRHRVLGIRSVTDSQIIFVDTPGLHDSGSNALNRIINKTAQHSLVDVDVIVQLCSAPRWADEDEWVLTKLKQFSLPLILAINKIDRLDDKQTLLPFIQHINNKGVFLEIVPISALKGTNTDELIKTITGKVTAGPALFPQDQITDQTQKTLAGELIREQLFRRLSQELPYATAVVIDEFKVDQNNLLRIEALIWVEKPGQKGIVIGHNGKTLKTIGEQARKQMEYLFDARVYLNLHVKVKQGWANNLTALQNLGYSDQV
ncbi:MAG: GTPase Era [Gammaproteobacteria bacterium]|nr:GTPase Era [Gammaproteobacteria bacterium]